MKAGPDASICNLLGEGHRAGPTMRYTGGCRACHCYLGNVVGSEHGFDDSRDAAAQDAMGARRKSRNAPVLIAKLMFSGISPVAFANFIALILAATTPTTSPLEDNSGPPLLPG